MEKYELESMVRRAHQTRVEDELRARAEASDERERMIAARRRSPIQLGLEECTECGWWRSPIPETALRSTDAFRTWQKMASARCMCTADRCVRCNEPMSLRVPTPFYYSDETGGIVRSGGMVLGMEHSSRCRALSPAPRL